MKIIAFTGMPFSGKSVAVAIAKGLNIPIIRMGDLVWEEVEKQGLPINSETVGRTANSMREMYGKEIWAKKTIDKIKSENIDDVLIIDGVRSCEEIDLFKKTLGGDFILIAIHTPEDIRYERALLRNRVDDIVLFKPLTLGEVEQIMGLLTRDLSKRLEARQVNVEITPAARRFIAEKGYDPVYGARPLRRYSQRELETRSGRSLIAGDVPEGAIIMVDLKNDALEVSHVTPS